MRIGFLFPGQGSQAIGIGKDLYDKYEKVKKVYDNVQKITGINIKEISFNASEEELNKTENTQLAILTHSLAILEILKKNNISADLSAGLSLGEYTALIEDGVFDFEDGVKLVKKRGEIMRDFAPKGNWKMSAILGLEEQKVNKICEQVKDGFVVPANYNTIGQIVISGDEKAVLCANELAKEAGARRTTLLKTTGPFHTEKLIECSKQLKKEIDKIKINQKECKVVKNIDGSIYSKSDDISKILSEHIMSPVRFTECLKTMFENGIDTFIEIGPSKTLSGFVKRMDFGKNVEIYNINNVETLEQTIHDLKLKKKEG